MKSTLSLKEQTGQMLITGFEGTALNPRIEDLILNRRVGGVILFERNFETPGQLRHMIQDLQALAQSVSPHLPLFITVDQEGGRVSRLKAPFTLFPPPCCLGRSRSESLARRFGRALGRELRAVGINTDYAPVLDVNTHSANPIIGERALSDDPHWTAKLGASFIRGMKEAGVLSVGKHFPGHGDTGEDSHLTLPTVGREAASLERVELIPFAAGIEQGLDFMMTAHVIFRAWDEKYPATFSQKILQGILRQKLGFKGLIVSDDLEMKAVEDHLPFEDFPALGIEAGLDLFMICHDTEKTRALQDRMIQDIENRRVDPGKVEASAGKIRAVKRGLPPAEEGFADLSVLAENHRALVDEMKSHLEN
ncbi:MAG: beta-N-acetylhexosaminidase [Nitrospinaceae bacterium]